jgi:hypothetical protein
MLDSLKAERVKANHALHDAEASRDLSAARAEAFDLELRLREHDHAISEAERRLQQAHAVEAKAADRGAAPRQARVRRSGSRCRSRAFAAS